MLIVDCDVHQGDGTAAIFAADRTVWTFSIHGARNFPFRKLGTLREHGVPVAITMAGVYAPDVEQIVEIHLTTVRIAARSA